MEMDIKQQKQQPKSVTSAVRKDSAVIQVITEQPKLNKNSSYVENDACQNRKSQLNEKSSKSTKKSLNCLILCNRRRKKKENISDSDINYPSYERSKNSQNVQDNLNTKHQCSSEKNIQEISAKKGTFFSTFSSFRRKHVGRNNKSDQECSLLSGKTKEISTTLTNKPPEMSAMILESSMPSARDNEEHKPRLAAKTERASAINQMAKMPEEEIESKKEAEHLDEHNLKNAVDQCEKRLERLYERLIWLRDSNAVLKNPSNSAVNAKETSAVYDSKTESISKSLGVDSFTDMASIQKQISYLSLRIHDLKCQIEAFSFLSWIGLLQEPSTNRMPIPGIRAAPPNPKLYLTRRPDSDARSTAREYRHLCEQTIADPVRLDLRRVTFNNWPWSDAWLIRFVRQMFEDLGFVETFHLPLKRLDLWLCDIYRRYNRVPFHNYKHAFMVTQMCYALLWNANLVEYLEKEEQMTLIISAICHDLDHPGFNNAYQINAGTELAVRYNDQSPLENHHCAMAFDILSHSEANPFEHLDLETMKRIRDGIIRCILATDMSRHNEIVNQFTSTVLNDLEHAWHIDEESKQPYWAMEKSKRDLVMMILIKVCDISNEARPLSVAGPWIDRLLAEFFHQSDYEKLVGLPAAPFMDREKVTKSASQCGFIRFVILPLFESLAKLLPQIKTLLVQPAVEQLNHYTEMNTIQEEQTREQGKEDSKSAEPEEEVSSKG